MKTYKSHKTVHATQIVEITGNERDISLTVKCDDGDSYTLTPDMLSRYTPKVGDYLVQYRDGYMSVSPRKEFEDGYAELVGERQSPEARRVDINPVDRLEPDIHPLDRDDALASIAISLKRMADLFDHIWVEAQKS